MNEAVNKPAGISSAQVLRDMQTHFNPSAHFKPWITAEREKREMENNSQRKRRGKAKQTVQVKMGHGGTLDPGATGVLVVGIGSGTKALPKFLDCTKTYDAVVLFGAATDSYDGDGKLVGHARYAHVTKDTVEAALSKFRGKFMQKPPIFSALSVNGKRLYEYAREGKEVPGGIEERPVEVDSIELTEWMEGGQHAFAYPAEAPEEDKKIAATLLKKTGGPDLGLADAQAGEKRKRDDGDDTDAADGESAAKAARTEQLFADQPPSEDAPSTSGEPEPKDVETKEPEEQAQTESPSKAPAKAPAARLRITSHRGFYVRSLCHDLGIAVDSLAFMAALERTRQGDFTTDGQNTLQYADLEKGETTWAPKVSEMLNHWTTEGNKK